MKKAKTAGMLKVWYQRLISYVGIVNFMMIFYLYIIEAPLGLQWYHWLIIIAITVITILFVDIKFIMPNANAYAFQKNPEFQELKKDVKEILKCQK